MSSEYLHIAYMPNARWLNSIIRRLNQSTSQTLQPRLRAWGDGPLREMGFALATKLRVLRQVIRRVNRRLEYLAQELNDPGRIKDCLANRAAYSIREKDLPYELLVDIDSFIFESRSCYEIVGKFLREFFKRILNRAVDEQELRHLLSQANIDTKWIEELSETRKAWFHESAPWIAVQVLSQNPLRFELLVLKRDVEDFSNPNDFLQFEQLRGIYRGFSQSMRTLQEWVIRQIEEFERREMADSSTTAI